MRRYLAQQELGKGKFEIVAPSLSILAEPPVAVVEPMPRSMAPRRWPRPISIISTRPAGQEIIAKNHYRPRDAAVAAKYAGAFPKIELLTIDRISAAGPRRRRSISPTAAIFDTIFAKRRR